MERQRYHDGPSDPGAACSRPDHWRAHLFGSVGVAPVPINPVQFVINVELGRCCDRAGAAIGPGRRPPMAKVCSTQELAPPPGRPAAASCRPSLARAATQCAVGRAREGNSSRPACGAAVIPVPPS